VQGGKVMNLQPILIVGLVVAALLYVVAMLLYRRRGMSTQRWYTTIGTAIVTLLVFALLGSIFPSEVGAGTLAALAIIGAAVTLGFAWLRRPQTR
jgi:ABC-type iron transport system FetAB permease component